MLISRGIEGAVLIPLQAMELAPGTLKGEPAGARRERREEEDEEASITYVLMPKLNRSAV